MRKTVLLINTPSTRGNRDLGAAIASMPPLGQMYIASYLKKNGYQVEIWDFAVLRLTQDEFLSRIQKLDPMVIGISSFYESWTTMKNLCEIVKIKFPEIYIAIGGNGATFSYEEILKETRVDYVMLGEGEKSFLSICEYLQNERQDLDDVAGLAYWDGDKVHVTKASRIDNLDELPFPDRHLIDINKYTYPFTICTTRGCVGQCRFCSSKAFYGKKIIFRSVENIIEEIKLLMKDFFINQFFIIDDSFTINKMRALYFCEELNKLEREFIWFCEARADTADKELLTALRNAGCFKIQFGMESGNNEILKSIGKQTTVEQIEQAVKIASKLGMEINLSFIVGHADDTVETINETFDFAYKMRNLYGANVLCSINTPYPGTYNFEHTEELGIKILTKKWDYYSMNSCIIDTKNLDHMKINKMFYEFHSKGK
ncbi:B12-binding domain-containing radical SAM protein [Lachnotalea glycerini]|uniref:Radical SAM protein n=1 Tax=Lachnotalea glycerini TaxID=1763509 RepID=A0A371JBH2_9FIRM|nr:radical SAM protein [Lachnotalea glycerini]RDY30016.1 radical SAM protein [Lachnotalea glycerini]